MSNLIKHSFVPALKVPMSNLDKEPLPYEKLQSNLKIVRSRLNRPLTISEKVLYYTFR